MLGMLLKAIHFLIDWLKVQLTFYACQLQTSGFKHLMCSLVCWNVVERDIELCLRKVWLFTLSFKASAIALSLLIDLRTPSQSTSFFIVVPYITERNIHSSSSEFSQKNGKSYQNRGRTYLDKSGKHNNSDCCGDDSTFEFITFFCTIGLDQYSQTECHSSTQTSITLDIKKYHCEYHAVK